MSLKTLVWLALGMLFGAVIGNASGISFTCDPNVDVSTCTYLNTTVASQYSSTFTNLNADIYIQYGTTELASSATGVDNQVTYNQYATALNAAAIADGNVAQADAVAALTKYDASVYGGDNVDVTSALANALGIGGDVQGGNAGISGPGGIACSTPGTVGCYNGIVTVTNAPGTFYYDNLGGTEAADQYDFYTTVEREVDELLGTSSCITTQTAPLSNNCAGNNTPSALDLFRYSSSGNLILDSSLSTTPGAYFSYNGGVTNGATTKTGVKFYNTLDNGDAYAEFATNCGGGAGSFSVQDAGGCVGNDGGLNITNDGGAEINMLNAVGYDVKTTTTTATPEPSTVGTAALFGLVIAFLDQYRRRRRAELCQR
jgi:hypothetical protein